MHILDQGPRLQPVSITLKKPRSAFTLQDRTVDSLLPDLILEANEMKVSPGPSLHRKLLDPSSSLDFAVFKGIPCPASPALPLRARGLHEKVIYKA